MSGRSGAGHCLRGAALAGVFSLALVAVSQADEAEGFVPGGPPEMAADMLADLRGEGGWLRLRDMGRRAPADPRQAAEFIARRREALEELRSAGWRLVCTLRLGARHESGRRGQGGGGNRAPLDLREAHDRGRELARDYGDLVDVWEIENEPDIGFFADNADVFAAYHKALALGLAAGRRAQGVGMAGDGRLAGSDESEWRRGYPRNPRLKPWFSTGPRRAGVFPGKSLVIMGPPALPPGPHFEQLLANGYLGYTEGVAFHYYGFAMDFAGVVAQFRDALQESAGGLGLRSVPVFLTEWGYSLLDGYDAQTVPGRVRQWRFVTDVARQAERAGIRNRMVFVLPPSFELKAKEFGIAMPPEEARVGHFGFKVDGGQDSGSGAEARFCAGGLTFEPGDFGAEELAPWMMRIGERMAEGEASPALAWLLAPAEGGKRARRRRGFDRPDIGMGASDGSRDWVIRADRPSPVVMDFVADPEVKAVKSYHGYWLGGETIAAPSAAARPLREGTGTMVFYNFGDETAEVNVVWPQWIRPSVGDPGPGDDAILSLAPGERREVAVRLCARADVFLPVEPRVVAHVRGAGGATVSRWASRFYARPLGEIVQTSSAFEFSAEAAKLNRERLLARPRAPEEPGLRPDGRWLTTDGMRVEETDWGWRLHVDHFPGEALRPAVAELPLPEGWKLEPGRILAYDYRLLFGPEAKELRADSPDPKRRRQTGIADNLAESYIRTESGNLFGTVPRLFPTEEWRGYHQSVESLTMHFLGRTSPPWRLSEHTPAALVFFVRPARLPAVFEVRRPRLGIWATSELSLLPSSFQ